jgi:hypothetical protein
MARQSRYGVQQDMRRIITAGYGFKECEWWHWKVYKDGMEIEVWPTTRKFMFHDGLYISQQYTDILKSLSNAFAMKIKKNNVAPIELTPEEKQAKEEVSEMRQGGLQYFINKSQQ